MLVVSAPFLYVYVCVGFMCWFYVLVVFRTFHFMWVVFSIIKIYYISIMFSLFSTTPSPVTVDIKNVNIQLIGEINKIKKELEHIQRTSQIKVQHLEKETESLKKDILYLIQFLHGYGLRVQCNQLNDGGPVMKENIEDWFNAKYELVEINDNNFNLKK
jgi:hypothetical protein